MHGWGSLSLEDDAVLRQLSAPEAVDENFHLVLADALRPPFPDGVFDTVVTPWLIDIITEDLPIFAARINRLLKSQGRWVNFGSLAFASPRKARCYSPEEVKAIVGEQGFSDPYVSQATIPYMNSPASRHGRQERVFTFSAYKERDVDKPERHKALPDWLVSMYPWSWEGTVAMKRSLVTVPTVRGSSETPQVGSGGVSVRGTFGGRSGLRSKPFSARPTAGRVADWSCGSGSSPIARP